MAIAPIKSHTENTSAGEPSDFAMPAGVRKMPTATTSPTTSAIAVGSPSCRLSVSRVLTENLSVNCPTDL